MRKTCVQLMTCLGLVLLLSGSALAFSLNTNFEGETISQANLTTTSGLNQWNDLVRWQVQSSGGNTGAWAQQTPNSPTAPTHETSLLFYGFDATGLGSGTPFSLEFDFINGLNSSSPGAVFLGGLTGSQQISRFAPWPGLLDTDFFTAELPNRTDVWTSWSVSGFLPDDYDVLYVAFRMGGYDGLRGIDNVSLDIAPVPEPSSILLLAAGMGGLILYRRKRLAG